VSAAGVRHALGIVSGNNFFHNLSETAVLRIVDEECALSPPIVADLNAGLVNYLRCGVFPTDAEIMSYELASLKLSWSNVGKYDSIAELDEWLPPATPAPSLTPPPISTTPVIRPIASKHSMTNILFE
jgi:hypothetical protein